MDSSDDSSDNELLDSADKDDLNFLTHASLKPKLDSIFVDVAQQLPDIEFNSEDSDADNDEDATNELTVFQREIVSPLDAPTTSPALRDNHDFHGLSQHQLSDEPPPLEAHGDAQDHFSQRARFLVPVARNGDVDSDDDDVEPELSHLTESDDDLEVIRSVSGPRRNGGPSTRPLRQNWMEEDVARSKPRQKENSWQTAERVVAKLFPTPAQSATVRKLTDHLNMESLLDCINRGEPLPQVDNTILGDMPSHVLTNRGLSPYERSNENVMVELAAFSSRVSGQNLDNLDPATGACPNTDNKVVEDLRESTESKKVLKLPYDFALEPGSSSRERETIFLDLRDNDKNKTEERDQHGTIERILKLEKARRGPVSSSSDSDDGDTDQELWFEQRKRLKHAIAKGTSTADLPSPAEQDLSRNPRAHAIRSKHISLFDRRYKKPPTPKFISRTKKPQSATVRVQNDVSPTDDAENEDKVSSENECKVPESTDQDEKDVDESEAMKILRRREREVTERETRMRFAKQLESLNPTSTPNNQPVATNTNTLFHVDVSYEPCVATLPCDLGVRELCLLTVHMSSNASMVTHRAAKGVDTDAGLSGSYTSLVTWLLSLVPDKLDNESDKRDPPRLFHIVGLQQMYFQDKLCLCVVVTPADPSMSNQKPKKTKGREELTLFQQQLNKFLSSSTLYEAAPWLGALFPQEIGPRHLYRDNDRENRRYNYRPPLPLVSSKPLSTYLHLSPDPGAAERVFSLEAGFFWQTMDTREQKADLESYGVDFQTAMSLLRRGVFANPVSMTGVFNRVLQDGLDVCGLRLLYDDGPVLALALRGKRARSIWLDAIGPSDPTLARKTDPNSLTALYCTDTTRDQNAIYCPRNPGRVNQDIVRYFAARVPKSGIVNVGKRKDKGDYEFSAPATLTCSVGSDVILAVSPLVPKQWLGVMLMICAERGYQLCGVRQMLLSRKKANFIGLSPDQHLYFRDEAPTDAPLAEKPCTLLILRRENCLAMSGGLVEAFMVQLALKGLLGTIHIRSGLASPSMDIDEASPSLVTSRMLFHVAPYSESVMTSLGGSFSKVTRQSGTVPGYVAPTLKSSPELEQVAVLILTGRAMMDNAGVVLASLLNMGPSQTKVTSTQSGMELLALKWLPNLTPHEAKFVTPYEVGRANWKSSLHTLQSEPVMVLLLRAVDVFRKLYDFCGLNKSRSNNQLPLDKLVSPTPELAYDYLTLFFDDRDIFPHADMRELRQYLPSEVRETEGGGQCYGEVLRHQLLAGHGKINSVLVVKPDGVKKHLVKIVKRLDQAGFQLVACRLATLSDQQADQLSSVEVDREDHVSHLTSGTSLLLVVRRENAVKKLVDLIGHADPQTAKRQDQLSWRALFGTDVVCNALYCSQTYEKSLTDISSLFPDGLCSQPTFDLRNTEIVCPCSDSLLDTVPRARGARRKSASLDTSASGTSLLSSASAHHVSLLMETNCILLRNELLEKTERNTSAYVTVINALVNAGCELVGCRLLQLTERQSDVTLHLYRAGTLNLVPALSQSPSMVLAFQCQNAVISFSQLLGGTLVKDSVYNSTKDYMLVPTDQQQALDCLAYYFDQLTPDAVVEIVARSETDC